MRIETKRLILRKHRHSDIDDVVEGLNNINVTRWLRSYHHPFTKRHANAWLKENSQGKDRYAFLIELKSEKKVIGAISLNRIDRFQGNALISYWLNEKYWKSGYGTEAMSATLKLAFEKLKLRRVEGRVFERNYGSEKLLERFGGQQEGYCRKAVRCLADGKIKSGHIYGILREDWKRATRKK